MPFVLRLWLAVCVLIAVTTTTAAQDFPKVVPLDETDSLPEVVKEVKPKYTRQAKAARIQGIVVMQVVVLSDGKVGPVRVFKSLDAKYGLDQEAVKAAKQWIFKPAMKEGKPVAVIVAIELTFKLIKA